MLFVLQNTEIYYLCYLRRPCACEEAKTGRNKNKD